MLVIFNFIHQIKFVVDFRQVNDFLQVVENEKVNMFDCFGCNHSQQTMIYHTPLVVS
jgi:hypothetical protein